MLRLWCLWSMLLLHFTDQVGLRLRRKGTNQASSQLIHLAAGFTGMFKVLDRQDCFAKEATIAVALRHLLVQLQLHLRLAAPCFREVSLSVLPRRSQDGIKIAAKLRLRRLLPRYIPVLLAYSSVDLKCVLLFLAPEVLARVQLT